MEECILLELFKQEILGEGQGGGVRVMRLHAVPG